MIEVSLKETHREFNLRVGDKLVGRVLTYRNGWCAAERYDQDHEQRWMFLDSFPTMEQAANRVLCYHGFGRAKRVEVNKIVGVRSR